MKRLLLAGAALLVIGSAANATPVLVFGQIGGADDIIATVNAAHTQTTITGTAVPVSVSDILGGTPAVPFNAVLNLSATSFGTAATSGGFTTQGFNGNFTVTNAAGTVNYLSGMFHDAVFGQNESLTLSASNGGGETVSLTSSVIPAADLASQQTVSLSFANVAPPRGDYRHHAVGVHLDRERRHERGGSTRTRILRPAGRRPTRPRLRGSQAQLKHTSV
jgi:hypothetical protein